MTHAVVPDATQPMLPSLLGRSVARIPTAGRIRAGIKVLTRKAAENARARELYETGVAQGQSFDAIERAIVQALPELKNPLVPKNVPYFTVRGVDFPNPEIAKQILESFGEDRGEGARRLYRFPVVFPSDAWQSVMPHELVAHTANERRYWSEYSADGQTRHCKCHAPVPLDASGRRTIRIFGGRKTMLRERNSGLCEPESCPEYQDRRCNLSGRFIFFIPGIRSISAFELGTNSFYAMNGAIQKFQTIAFMRGGRISGFLDGRGTTFYLSKKLLDVPRIDEEGRAVRVAQWIIDLEAPIDVTALLRPDEGNEAITVRAAEAVSVLEGQGTPRIANRAPEVFDLPPATHGSDPIRAEGHTVVATASTAAVAKASQEPATTSMPLAQHVGQGSPDNDDESRAAVALAERLGIAAARYEAYANKRWGKGWKLNAGGRKRALDELRGFDNDAQGFPAKVNAELDVFS